MRTLYVVTHTEATHHVDGLLGGWSDTSLTGRGQAQALALARALRAAVPPRAPVQVFSSDLRRALETAAPIGEVFDVCPVELPGLREICFGEAEGRPPSWRLEHFAPLGDGLDPLHHTGGIPGGETRAQLGERVYLAMEHVLAHSTSHTVIVTHGFALSFVVAWWIGMPLAALGRVSFRGAPGGITELGEDDVFGDRAVVRCNDTQHLVGL